MKNVPEVALPPKLPKPVDEVLLVLLLEPKPPKPPPNDMLAGVMRCEVAQKGGRWHEAREGMMGCGASDACNVV